MNGTTGSAQSIKQVLEVEVSVGMLAKAVGKLSDQSVLLRDRLSASVLSSERPVPNGPAAPSDSPTCKVALNLFEIYKDLKAISDTLEDILDRLQV